MIATETDTMSNNVAHQATTRLNEAVSLLVKIELGQEGIAFAGEKLAVRLSFEVVCHQKNAIATKESSGQAHFINEKFLNGIFRQHAHPDRPGSVSSLTSSLSSMSTSMPNGVETLRGEDRVKGVSYVTEQALYPTPSLEVTVVQQEEAAPWSALSSDPVFGPGRTVDPVLNRNVSFEKPFTTTLRRLMGHSDEDQNGYLVEKKNLDELRTAFSLGEPHRPSSSASNRRRSSTSTLGSVKEAHSHYSKSKSFRHQFHMANVEDANKHAAYESLLALLAESTTRDSPASSPSLLPPLANGAMLHLNGGSPESSPSSTHPQVGATHASPRSDASTLSPPLLSFLVGYVNVSGSLIISKRRIKPSEALDAISDAYYYHPLGGVSTSPSSHVVGGGSWFLEPDQVPHKKEDVRESTSYWSSFFNGKAALGANASATKTKESRHASSLPKSLQPDPKVKILPIFSMPPSVLFCDVNMRANEPLHCKLASTLVSMTKGPSEEPWPYTMYADVDLYELDLPAGLPSSHSGKIFKIHYRFVLGLQMKEPNGTIKSIPLVFDVPFRVFHSPSILSSVTFEASNSSVSNSVPTASMYDVQSPILLKKNIARLTLVEEKQAPVQGEPFSVLQHALHMPGGASYQIRHGTEPLIRLILEGPPFCLGQDIRGRIEFQSGSGGSPSPVYIYQLKISLEIVEQVDSKYASTRPDHRQTSSLSSDASGQAQPFGPDSHSHRQVLASQESFGLCTTTLPLLLYCPASLAPSFQTTLASVSYHLHFQFFIGTECPWQPLTLGSAQDGGEKQKRDEKGTNSKEKAKTSLAHSAGSPDDLAQDGSGLGADELPKGAFRLVGHAPKKPSSATAMPLEFFECFIPLSIGPGVRFADLSLHHGHYEAPGLYQWSLSS